MKTDLDGYMKQDKETKELHQKMVDEAIEFLENNGYEVHEAGTLGETIKSWSSTGRGGTEYTIA